MGPSKQCDIHVRSKLLVLPMAEVEEGFLLQSCGKADWILQVNFSIFIIEASAERCSVRDGKGILDGVIDMKTPGTGIGCRYLEVPTAHWGEIDGPGGPQGLRNPRTGPHCPPCAKVLRESLDV